MEKEIRSFQLAELRTEGEGDEPKKIVGYAAVYNRQSENLGGFVEIIEPGFFDSVLDGDTVSLWNHNDDKPLGRTTNGTLQLSDDELGLRTVTIPPDTTWGRDALESIKRGDVSQMSFCFTVKMDGDKWEEKNGLIVRTLKKGGCDRLYDISPVTFPAYPQTSAAVRSRAEEVKKQLHTEQLAGGGSGGQPDEQIARARLENQKRMVEILEKENIGGNQK